LLIGGWSSLVRSIGVHVQRIEQLFNGLVSGQPATQHVDELGFVTAAFMIPIFIRQALALSCSFKAVSGISKFMLLLRHTCGVAVASNLALRSIELTVAHRKRRLRLFILPPQRLLARTDIAAPAHSRQSFSGFKLCRLLSLLLVGTTPRYPVLAALRDLFSSGRRWQCA